MAQFKEGQLVVAKNRRPAEPAPFIGRVVGYVKATSGVMLVRVENKNDCRDYSETKIKLYEQ